MKEKRDRIQCMPGKMRKLILLLLITALTAGCFIPVSAEEPGTRGLMDDLLEGVSSALGENRQIRNCRIEQIDDQTYTGRSITPVIKITYLGVRLRKGTDYTVTFSNNRSVGTAKAKITGKGRYTGTKTVYFKIVRKNTASGSSSSGTSSTSVKGKTFKVSLSTNSYVYNGQYRKPSVKVTLGSKTITARYYTVKYSDNRSVGTATVTVTGKGDYSGCKGTAKFTITLKKPVISSVKSTTEGEISVSWKSDSQADGYQIQYCTRKNFSSGEKTKYERSGRTTGTTITGLVSGKKYYVRMRSYKKTGSKNSYSEWSTIKEKTVK
ncbi:MAG: fibronectin type III domain-containing protein [Blautia sp.]|nr:fibronectin type III domain-containing protein [Blautia sp.]